MSANDETDGDDFLDELFGGAEPTLAGRRAYEAAIADFFGAAMTMIFGGRVGIQLDDFFGSGLVVPEAAFLTAVLDRHQPIHEQCNAMLDRMIALSLPLAEAEKIWRGIEWRTRRLWAADITDQDEHNLDEWGGEWRRYVYGLDDDFVVSEGREDIWCDEWSDVVLSRPQVCVDPRALGLRAMCRMMRMRVSTSSLPIT